MNNPNCPGCAKPLQKVKQSANSMLNAEQFDAARAGDWFCPTCPGNNQARTGYRYFWDKDLAAPQAAEEQLRRMRAAFHINMLRAFPDKTHAEIAAEIDKACGAAPQAATTASARCVICCADEPRTGTCGSDDPRALCNQATTASASDGEKQ